MELNAEQVKNEIQSLIKALKDCGGWVKRGNGEGWFNHEILADALALINSQEQRIKELTEKIVELLSQVDCDKAEIKLLRKHIESLGTTIEMQEQEVHSIKADTVRKMQERLTKEFDRMHKSNFITVEVRQWIIDQIAKEMLEGE